MAIGGRPPYDFSRVPGKPATRPPSRPDDRRHLGHPQAAAGTSTVTVRARGRRPDRPATQAVSLTDLAVHPGLHRDLHPRPGECRALPTPRGLVARNGTAPYTWAVTGGALPTGLTLDPGGPPHRHAGAAGSFGVTVTVTDATTPAVTASQHLRSGRYNPDRPVRSVGPDAPSVGSRSHDPARTPPSPTPGASALAPGTYDGSVVIVTGGGTGLGKSIATEFGRLGASVGILSRDEEHRAAGVAAVRGGRGDRLRRRRATSATPTSIAAAFDAVEEELGPIDVLINNAAGNFPVPAEDMSPNAWRTVVDIVLNGTFLCCRDLARRLIPAERDGAIVNVGASYAWTGGPGFAHSAAAKAGVKNLTETLAVEWGPYGIRVNGLVPGLMPHEDEVAAIAAVPGKYEGQDSRVPAGRVGFPRELAWAATYLCSPYATYISGHSLVVDGANWQRRHTVQPPFTPIREQLDRPPFDAERPGRPRKEPRHEQPEPRGPAPGRPWRWTDPWP